ncbi:SDR family NAD(P)-dependent oxidoreductase [Yeosuana sp.]|uniref:SDR family NAD(P)-dependent oxidoreductase n=1 Tax=Yeosuana sp. TaxID=2529388 RepID=UPI004054A652|tara:strand:- start:1216 stop:2037 length:822 start_codon:yes stop_codon:yes gene_type:complete
MKNSKIKNKTALITGAASGLGFEFSILLAKDFYNLILVDIDKANLQTAKKIIQRSYNIKIKVLVKDLSKVNIAQEIFDEIKSVSIDVLINNAGFGLFGPFVQTSWQKESNMLNLHVMATTQMTKLFLIGMVQRRSGKILNVSSVAAFEPGPLMSIYYASKAYILSFSEAIANELQGTGVTLTTLCPGPTKTKFQEVVANSSSKNEIRINMASAKDVAKIGYKAMLAGKEIIIPGLLNKVIAFLPRLMSRNKVTSIVRKIQEKNRATQLIFNNS